MNAPRWFYVVLAVCAVGLTASGLWVARAVSVRARYVAVDAWLFDTQSATWCSPRRCTVTGAAGPSDSTAP